MSQTRSGQSAATRLDGEESADQRAASAPSEADFKVLAERFNLALWAADTAIWDWDIENKLLWGSAGHQQMFGLDDPEITENFDIEAEGNPWVANLHPDDRDATVQALRNHLDQDTPFDVEYRYRRPGGEYLWLRSVGRAVRDPAGKALRMIGSDSDITAQKLAETENRQFREAVDNASEGIVLYDADERFVYANKRYREQFPILGGMLEQGALREDLRKAFISLNVLPDAVGREDEFIKELRVRQLTGATTEHRFSNGDCFKYSDHILPDGAIVSIRTDITEIRRREEELKASETRYRSLVEDQPDLVSRYLPDGTLTYVNNAYAKQFGQKPEDMVGKNIFDFMPQEERSRVRQHIAKLTPEAPFNQIENRVVRSNGALSWQERVNRAFFDDAGRLTELQAFGRDITDRKQVEETLRESEARFRSIFEEAAFGIAIVTLDGRLVECNSAWSKMLGYAAGELKGKPWEDYTHPDDIAKNNELSEKLIHAEIANYRMEKRFLRKDGGLLWTHLTVSLIGAGDGRPQFRLAMIEDISERKRAEVALRESEQNLAGLTANIADSVVTIDEGGTVLSFNKAAERAFGYRADEIIGDRVERLMPNPHADMHQRYVSHYRETGESAILGKGPREVEGLRKDGSLFPLELSVSEMVIGEQRTFIGAMRDITRRKQVEEALREREQMLGGIFETAAIGITVNDPEGRYIKTNPAYRSMLGYTEQEFSGMTFWDLTHPDDRGREEPIYADIMAGDQAIYQIDKRYIHKNGSSIWVSLNVAELKDAEGSVVGCIATVEDITERRRNTEALRESEKRLGAAQQLAHVGNWEINLVSGSLVWSDQMFRLFGLDGDTEKPSKELFLSVVHPDDRIMVKQALVDQASPGSVYNFGYRIVLPDGTVRFAHESVEQILDAQGILTGVRGTTQDITELRIAEEALRENEANLAEAQRVANMGSWVVTLEGKRQIHTSWSAQLCRIFGIGLDAVPRRFD